MVVTGAMVESGRDQNLLLVVSIEDSKNPPMYTCGTLMDPCGSLPLMNTFGYVLKRLCWVRTKEDNITSPFPTPTPPLLQIISVQKCKLL